ncbi:MAG: archease [Planctomycetota bacterium]
MDYSYFEEDSLADVAFRARADNRESLFVAAADATMNVMVENLDSVQPAVRRAIHAEEASCEMLLFNLLQTLIYYKDAESLLLRVTRVSIKQANDAFVLDAESQGEEMDPKRHSLNTDVKAVTLSRFSVSEDSSGWEAYVVLDV